MRKSLVETLLKEMETNNKIWFLTGDLGYKLFDPIRDKYPDRFVNCGASEFSMLGMAVGLAMEGKIPFVYSITPFLIYRGFEIIRNYINKYNIAVKLLGGGRDQDYHIDGFSHDASDIKHFLNEFDFIKFYPKDEDEMLKSLQIAINNKEPYFISLKK